MRVALAEDLFLLRDGLKHLLLAHGIEVSAAVGNAPSLLAHVESAPCDLAVIDVRLPPDFTTEGLDAAREIRRRRPGFPVLMLSQYVEPLYAQELLSDGDGAIGYLLKERVVDAGQFVATLSLIAAGGTAMDPDVITRMLARPRPDSQLGALTPRELQVLAVMAEGRSNGAIGQELFLSEGSISKYTASIFAAVLAAGPIAESSVNEGLHSFCWHRQRASIVAPAGPVRPAIYLHRPGGASPTRVGSWPDSGGRTCLLA